LVRIHPSQTPTQTGQIDVSKTATRKALIIFNKELTKAQGSQTTRSNGSDPVVPLSKEKTSIQTV